MEHRIAGWKRRHKAASFRAVALVALWLPLGPAPARADEPGAPRAGRYATGTVEGRRLAFEVISGHLVAAR